MFALTLTVHPDENAGHQTRRVFTEVDRPPEMPKTIGQTFYRRCEGKNEPASAAEVRGIHTGDHDDKVARVKPKELFPRILRPPMLSNSFEKTATKQGFINHMDDIRSDHEPAREDQRNVHTVAASAARKSNRHSWSEALIRPLTSTVIRRA